MNEEHNPQPAAEPSPRIAIGRFLEIQLRVARVIAAERIPKTDFLLKLEVDLGDERRQLVAGIAARYSPEELVGKQVIVVANLEPATIRGVQSQGMLLAADDGGGPVVATFEVEVRPGTQVR